VQALTENDKRLSMDKRCFTMVVLPEPDGAQNMMALFIDGWFYDFMVLWFYVKPQSHFPYS
jgi:hypothetical protein